jgi:hypothetical protein
VGTSYWNSRDDLDQAEQVGSETRQRVAETGGATGEAAVERFEVALDTMA